jgi:hypothetical protein
MSAQVPIGVSAPVILSAPIQAPVGGLDLTTVTAVTFTVLKPDGSRSTWLGTIVGGTTPTLLTAQYAFTGVECNMVGTFLIRANLTTAGGTTPCMAQKLFVTAI